MNSTLHSMPLEEIETKLASSRAQIKDLATMGTVVTRIHEIDAVLSVVMDMAIRLVEGEVGILLTEKKGKLHGHVAWGVTEDFVHSIEYKDGLDIASYCFKHKEPILLSNLKHPTKSGACLDSAIALPLLTRDRCLGVIIIINKANGGEYTDEDRELLEMLLSFVAVAIDNSNMMAEQLTRQKIEQEMEIARQIQETILPRKNIQFSGASIGAVYSPAREVGGDFYDAIKIDDDRLLVVLGDVSSKGVPAALVMSACSAIIRSLMKVDPELEVKDLVEGVNSLLADEIIRDREMFATLFFAQVNLKTKKLTYCNAGHIPGLFWDSKNKEVVQLSDGGPLIGQFSGIPYVQKERSISSKDRLFLCSDGLTEAADKNGNLFGRERMERIFLSGLNKTPEESCKSIEKQIEEFSKDAPEMYEDDFTVMQVEVR